MIPGPGDEADSADDPERRTAIRPISGLFLQEMCPFVVWPVIGKCAGAQKCYQYVCSHNITAEIVIFTIPPAFPLVLSRAYSDLYLYLCDLLCGFMLQHSYQSHFFVLGNNIASRIASLLYSREKHLRLGTPCLLSLVNR